MCIRDSNTTGDDLILQAADHVMLKPSGGELGLVAHKDGAVHVYYDGVKKAETVTGGFTVTGTCTATAFAGDGSALTGISAGPGTGEMFVKMYSGNTASNSGTNTLAGYNAGNALTGSANNNTFIGKEAGASLTGEGLHTAVGE